MAYITFTDTTGAATLTPYPDAGNTAGQRFRNWRPFQRSVGEGAWALGDGKRYQFSFRDDYGAEFEVPGIPGDDLGVALRLQRHLLWGGTCNVYTVDADGNAYTNCCLAPDADIEGPALDERDTYEFVLTLRLITLEAVPMICRY